MRKTVYALLAMCILFVGCKPDVEFSVKSGTVKGKAIYENYELIIKYGNYTCYWKNGITVTAGTDTSVETKNIESSDTEITHINWLGDYSSENEINNPKKLDAYFNTTDGRSYEKRTSPDISKLAEEALSYAS